MVLCDRDVIDVAENAFGRNQMSRHRRLGVLLALVAIVALGAAALISPYEGRFVSGLPGIESDLAHKAASTLIDAEVRDAQVTADGRDIVVTLRSGLPEGTSEGQLRAALLSVEGVRAVTFNGSTAVTARDLPTADIATDANENAGNDTESDEAPMVAVASSVVLAFADGSATLSGVATSQADADLMTDAAIAALGAEVDLTIADRPDGEVASRTVATNEAEAFAALTAVVAGTYSEAEMRLDGDFVSISGVASSSEAASITSDAIADLIAELGVNGTVEATVAQPDDSDTGENDSDETDSAADAGSSESGDDTASTVALLGDLVIPDISFVDGTADLTADGEAAVAALAAQLDGLSTPISIQAYTNEAEDPDGNVLLSTLQARRIVSVLGNAGVDTSLLSSAGLGAPNPLADNVRAQDQPIERRVDLVMIEGN